MQWRRYFPAIAVGANTVLRDDPSLTSRIDGSVWCPKRFVVDRTLKTVDADPLPKLYSDAYREQTIVLCSAATTKESRSKLSKQGIAFWELPEVEGHLDLRAFREQCARECIYGASFVPWMRSAAMPLACAIPPGMARHGGPRWQQMACPIGGPWP